LRYLLNDTIGKDMWKLLWICPSLPYYKFDGVFEGKENLTKKIIFSTWNAVPDAISTILSYEAERKIVKSHNKTDYLYSKLSETATLLEYRMLNDKPANMTLLAWMLPWKWLAKTFDPLVISVDNKDKLTSIEMIGIIEANISKKINELPEYSESGMEDLRWYWYTLFYFEKKSDFNNIRNWEKQNGKLSNSFKRHIDYLYEVVEGNVKLGKKPKDLANVLAQIAIAGPGTCSYRALSRYLEDINDFKLYNLAANIGDSFRSLFNKPENTLLIRGLMEGNDYWRQVLDYSINGNLQSMIDEQFHLYAENLKAKFNPSDSDVGKVFQPFIEALTLKTSRVKMDQLVKRDNRVEKDRFNIRCNFALRFGDIKDGDGKSLSRTQDVQSAFNSPFKPFVLACTSVGQEGLDFHVWCHSVVHWNLPSNPVDLEQREGRVQRYKGLAIRRNIAQKYGLEYLKCKRDRNTDVWQWLFEEASKQKDKSSSDLIPYWIYEEGDCQIKRIIPILPYSKEVSHYEKLKDALTLYRLAFGQPRQEDLLAFLSENIDSEDREKLNNMQIVLKP